MATELELAWAAGFFDGEGHVGIKRSHERRKCGIYMSLNLVVTVANTHAPTIAKFMQIVGVSGNTCVYPDRRPENKRNRILYTARFSANHAYIVLKLLLPYLVTRKEQAEVGIAFRETFTTRKGRGKGHPIPPDVLELREQFALQLKSIRAVGLLTPLTVPA